MNGHPQFEEDFDLYALGSLDGEEKMAMEAHLAGCSECRAEVASARARVSLLALGAPQVSPPAHARLRVLEAFKAAKPGGRAAEPPARPLPTSVSVQRSSWAPLWAAACLALLAAAAWFAVEAHRLTTQLSELQAIHRQTEESSRQLQTETAQAQAALDVLTAPDTVQVELTAAAARPVPQGKAFYNPMKGLLFYAAGLPSLPAGRTYELWLIPSEGAPVDAGVFETDARGNGQVLLPRLPQGLIAKAFAVTIEPAGGVPAPAGPKVLIGPVA